ncbi:MAG: nucleoside deaminase [Candidatus Aminicenantes bacterium]|nr:nucleoside deaminase [Acidobacteriota bacterium]MBU4405633.1 nucleoside deaminase [Acidobacteriota bacterium]MCG2812158.1 nucleoside deaminase [Candidatus Aminicenantes bacterium]
MKHEKNPDSGILLTLPFWLEEILAGKDLIFPDNSERMRWVIELSRQNVEHGSGGPFAAAIFTANSGKLLAAGVNRVEPLNCSPAHAEVLAIAFAQQNLQSWDLGKDAGNPTELLSSSQPCLMCLGATLWSGVTRLTYAATADDVSTILGFDEGPLPAAWTQELQKRSIAVEAGLLRAEAIAVLGLYSKKRGTIYNSRKGF